VRVSLHRRSVADALPPSRLLAGLPPGGSPYLVDALGPGGWGVGPGGDGPGIGLLAVEPDRWFEGGIHVLTDVRRWLDAQHAGEPHASIAMGSIDYDGGAPVRLAAFRAVYRYDARTRTAEVVGSSRVAVDRLAEQVSIAARTMEIGPRPLPEPAKRTSDADHARAVEAVKTYIREGDVYQVNLSRRLEVPAPEPDELRRLFARLARCAAAPWSAYLESRGRTVLSASPECFLRVRGSHIETCPIKGTRPRGRTPDEDEALRKALEASAKDRAEHVMIVDLERNDLGRVCEIGSVRVATLADLQSFSDVHHLVSRVEGQLSDPGDWPALLAATFPGGSITGAPKRRAMEIIAELEPVPRGLYTGAIGVFDAAGGIDLSIAIRTAVAEDGVLRLQLGGGVVADSDAEDELRETRDKGRAFARSWGFDV
jgi:anthranilate/para-aminobenzoate synthase component I